jgi:AraC-like DNA-binding protein/mannose-6-phosphate isomerase-like protein (cupin superfamily)
MPKKTSIPVNAMAEESGIGIGIEKLSFNELSLLDQLTSEEGQQSHRHDSHSFFLLERGSVDIELDFEKYTIIAPSVIYVHPDQVHRTTAFDNVTVSSLAMNNENLTAEYLTLLESITPAKPLVLDKETFSILSETVGICMKFYERKSDRLYHPMLKDSCNAFVALVVSQYLVHSKPADKLSRFEIVTKSFRELLERNYKLAKRPAVYAQKLNISTPYLNECVKNATGYPVSHHIQQRVVLEAKRLLYHSDTSVKEIAAVLGYDDYPYFSRLFTKATGMTAITFRNKNLD